MQCHAGSYRCMHYKGSVSTNPPPPHTHTHAPHYHYHLIFWPASNNTLIVLLLASQPSTMPYIALFSTNSHPY